MSKAMWVVGGLALALLGSGARAEDFKVQGINGAGLPGGTGFVDLVYDYGYYGPGFGVQIEDFQFEYEIAGITFAAAKSTVGASAASSQGFLAYMDALKQAANDLGGNVLSNPNKASPAGFKGYAMSFYTDGRQQPRSGQVTMHLAFDILPTALSGPYVVSFTNKNLIVDGAGNEYTYPAALPHLGVTVVPEPQIAWLLLPGLALVGLYSRRRADRRS